MEKGNLMEAERLILQSLHYDTHDFETTVASLNDLATLSCKKQRYSEAERLYRQILIIYESTLGANHSRTATILCNLAMILEIRGDHAIAETMLRRCLKIKVQVLGEHHPDIANILYKLSYILKVQKKLSKAEVFAKRALINNQNALVSDDVHKVIYKHNLDDIRKLKKSR